MADISNLFVTRLYRARLNDLAKPKINYDELRATCEAFAEDDEAGQTWCEENGYPGYTSYASLNDLPWRAPIFADLQKALDLSLIHISSAKAAAPSAQASCRKSSSK